MIYIYPPNSVKTCKILFSLFSHFVHGRSIDYHCLCTRLNLFLLKLLNCNDDVSLGPDEHAGGDQESVTGINMMKLNVINCG